MKTFFFVCALLFSSLAFSQEHASLRGHITDLESFGEPLLYANVELKGAEVKTQTNLHGNFEIDEVAPGSYTLVISYLGYETNEIPLEIKENETLEINASLSAKTINVDLSSLLSENTKEITEEQVVQKEQKD